MKRWVFLALGAATLLGVGCGGGGNGLSTTRARVQTFDRALSSRGQFDPMTILAGGSNAPRGGMADALGGFLGSNNLPPAGFGGGAYSRAKAAGKSRAESGGFYYDGYLKLWAQRSQNDTETTTETRWDFYVDEAKTQSGGFVSSLQPKWNQWVYPAADVSPEIGVFPPPIYQPTYPIVYKTSYAFTAGTLSGSRGLSENVTNADYSFDSKYENVYADGWKDKGNNHYDSGGSTWFSRIETADGKFAEAAGTYRGAIGGSRMESSEGYKADYQFTANGSGHGTISGGDPGMPVTISWDASGNVLVRYDDGTTESFQRNYYGGVTAGGTTGSGPIPVDGPNGIGDTPMPVEGDGGIGGPAGG